MCPLLPSKFVSELLSSHADFFFLDVLCFGGLEAVQSVYVYISVCISLARIEPNIWTNEVNAGRSLRGHQQVFHFLNDVQRLGFAASHTALPGLGQV